ncbi:hypothetical protein AAMO2058_001530800 [Amorphochlora amoebiformis]|mmetsp:Transcript_21739/g.34353  ORF Transcript_21739/g.34353 Transcript_21739/m.34353 type:complete len:280 (-) Transcript_21739:190-1029(-)
MSEATSEVIQDNGERETTPMSLSFVSLPDSMSMVMNSPIPKGVNSRTPTRQMSGSTINTEYTQSVEERKRVMQVNYYVNGVGEESFIPTRVVGQGTKRMRKIGYRTIRLEATGLKERTRLSGQIMAGFLRGRCVVPPRTPSPSFLPAFKDSKTSATFQSRTSLVQRIRTCSALMCFGTENRLEVLSCEPGFRLSDMYDLEILPVLHLREYKEFRNLEELTDQLLIDIRCAQYLPVLYARTRTKSGGQDTMRCAGGGMPGDCRPIPCTACNQTCAMCVIS